MTFDRSLTSSRDDLKIAIECHLHRPFDQDEHSLSTQQSPELECNDASS